MSFYLHDHPPASPQYRSPRREPLSGGVVLHSAEGGLWAPAGNVAGFISRRPDPGSYHTIIDPQATVELLPDTDEAFHVAADGHNRHTYGLCFSTSANLWTLSADDDLALRRAGHRIAMFAIRWANGDMAKARQVARIIDRQQALNRQPGITLHGVLQPSDRSDAWLNSPHRAELERRIVAYTFAHLQEDDMPTAEEIADALMPRIEKALDAHDTAQDTDRRRMFGAGSVNRRLLEAAVGADLPDNADSLTDEQLVELVRKGARTGAVITALQQIKEHLGLEVGGK